MLRTTNCGALTLEQLGEKVTLAGWVQKTRDKGFMLWVDLRDRYGITQVIFDEERTPKAIMEKAQGLGREFVIQVQGTVIERESKNPNLPTGAIEILAEELMILNQAKPRRSPSKTKPMVGKNCACSTAIWIFAVLRFVKISFSVRK